MCQAVVAKRWLEDERSGVDNARRFELSREKEMDFSRGSGEGDGMDGTLYRRLVNFTNTRKPAFSGRLCNPLRTRWRDVNVAVCK